MNSVKVVLSCKHERWVELPINAGDAHDYIEKMLASAYCEECEQERLVIAPIEEGWVNEIVDHLKEIEETK